MDGDNTMMILSQKTLGMQLDELTPLLISIQVEDACSTLSFIIKHTLLISLKLYFSTMWLSNRWVIWLKYK